nr:hypothetical protein [uncultured Holophaga sp.]
MSEKITLERSTVRETQDMAPGLASALAKALKIGVVRGVVHVASTQGEAGEGSALVLVFQELVRRDIMVLVGRGGDLQAEDLEASTGEALAEFCTHLGITPALGAGGDFHGLCVLLAGQMGLRATEAPVLSWKGHPADLESMSLVEELDGEIHARRLRLGWCDRYHCNIYS